MVKPPELSPERQEVITATDSTILLGAVPDGWGTPDSVWLDKMGLSRPKKPTLSMFLGHVFESHIRLHYEALLPMGYTMTCPGFARMENEPFGCTPDGWVEDAIGMAGYGFEAKSTTSRAEWGPSGTEEVPDRVYIQVQHSMMVKDASRWDVGAFFYDKDDKEEIACRVMQEGGLSLDDLDRFVNDRRFYSIARNEDMISQIREAGLHFWGTYVATKTRPGDAAAATASIKKKLREIENAELIPSLEEFVALRKIAADAVSAAEAKAAEIRNALASFDADVIFAGRFQAKLSEVTRTGKTDFEEAFKVACSRGNLDPAIVAEIMKTYKKPNAVSYRLDVKEKQ